MNFFIVAMISSTVLIPLTATATNSINSIYDDGQYLDYIAKQITENLEDDENEESQQDKWLDFELFGYEVVVQVVDHDGDGPGKPEVHIWIYKNGELIAHYWIHHEENGWHFNRLD